MMGKFRRMTIRMPSGVIMQPEWDFHIAVEDYDKVQKILERLADYEDMEGSGRLALLPCKMGMAAWAAIGGRVIEISVTGIKAGAAGRIYTADLDCESGCSIEECGGCEVYEWYDAHRGNEGEVELTEEDFGKIVFFDREEAEKALEQERGGTHEDS